MGTGIEWTEETWNPVVGCTPVFTGDVRTVPDRLTDPLHWRKPRMVFVNSMSDLFHEAVPFEFIDRVFAVMALCPQHTFQVLTKRPERMAEYLNTPGRMDQLIWRAMLSPDQEFVPNHEPHTWPLPNVWLGTSVEDQARADERIPHLLRCPAAVRFLSCEPLLGPVDLERWLQAADPGDLDREVASIMADLRSGRGSVSDAVIGDALHWVIVGGESGAHARPCDVGWIRSIVRQCRAAKVPVFVKQLGKRPRELGRGEPMPMPWTWDDGGEQIERWYNPADRKGGNPAEWPEDLRVREMPGGQR
jgi:protein gp37